MIACADCRYYSPGARSAAKEGTCHRNAPFQLTDETVVDPDTLPEAEPDDDGIVTLVSVEVTTYTGWPDVMAHDWCGEWQWSA